MKKKPVNVNGIKEIHVHHYHRNVTVLEQAFIGMIASAIEVYKQESFGALIGEVHKKHYLVFDSYTFQTAKRTTVSVTVKKARQERLDNALKFFTKSKVLGDFHSHPEGPHYLSKWDKDEIVKGPSLVSVLVSIYRTSRHTPWTRNEDLSISGSLAKKYFIRISAFEADKQKGRVCPIKVVCPYLRKINKLKLYEQRIQ